MLIGAGARCDAVDNAGRTSLMLAAGGGMIGVVELLIEKASEPEPDDADICINNQDKVDGATALMLAALHDSPEVVQLLLVNGAKPDIVDKHNQTALEIARTHGKSKVLHEPGLRDPAAYVKSYFEGEAEDKARWLESEEGKLQDVLTQKIEQMTRDVMTLTEKRLSEIHEDYERRRREEMEAEAERRLAEWKEKRMLEAEEANAKLEMMKQEQ